jgi:hypothetical protein
VAVGDVGDMVGSVLHVALPTDPDGEKVALAIGESVYGAVIEIVALPLFSVVLDEPVTCAVLAEITLLVVFVAASVLDAV